jgi:hypothetical protein
VLFGVIYMERNPSVVDQKRSLKMFLDWQPPIEIKGHWAFAVGGGMAVVEAESAAALVEAITPWTPFFEVKAEPIVEIEASLPIIARAYDWRDSVI